MDWHVACGQVGYVLAQRTFSRQFQGQMLSNPRLDPETISSVQVQAQIAGAKQLKQCSDLRRLAVLQQPQAVELVTVWVGLHSQEVEAPVVCMADRRHPQQPAQPTAAHACDVLAPLTHPSSCDIFMRLGHWYTHTHTHQL